MKKLLFTICILAFTANASFAQEETTPELKDPTQPSKLIQETKEKIRNVEQYDKLKRDFDKLVVDKSEMESKLNNQIDELTKEKDNLQTEIANLKADFAKQLAEMRNALKAMQTEEKVQKEIRLPEIEVKSKAIGDFQSIVTLSINGKSAYFQQGEMTKISIDGQKATAMVVKSISRNLVEIDFPELNRSLALH